MDRSKVQAEHQPESPVQEEGAASVSRRQLLGRAIGAAAAGAAGAALAAAGPVSATNGDTLKAGQNNAAETSTAVNYDGAAGFGGVVLLGNDSGYDATDSAYPAALGGWAGGGLFAGYGGVKHGVYGYTDHPDGFAVIGFNGGGAGSGGAGVYGLTEGGAVGVLAEDNANTSYALKVKGKAAFSRSGRATVLAGKSYVDVTVSFGLASTSNVLATLQTHRAGVHVEACVRNYPSTGKVRIYLNKVASATSPTFVAWWVFG